MVNLVNDRGIHICKSMIAWEKFANGATPESTGTKGDHFVGDYYVRFDKEYKAQIKELMEQGKTEEEAKKAEEEAKKAEEEAKKADLRPRYCWRLRRCCVSGRPGMRRWFPCGGP